MARNRLAKFLEGVSVTAPTGVRNKASGLESFANDAAFEAVYGAGQAGDQYFNTTIQMVRTYKNAAWENYTGDEIDYDNATSGLTAQTVQDAIDEVEGRVDTVESGKQNDVITTRGDLVVGSASGEESRLPVGSSGQVLKTDGIDVIWGPESGGGSGVKNYIANPDAAVDTSDTSTTANVTIARTTTAANLPEESKGTAFAITASGAATDGTNYAEFNASSVWDDADARRVGSALLKAKATGGWKFYAYNVTDSVIAGQISDQITYEDEFAVDVRPTAAKDIRIRVVPTTPNPPAIYLSGITLTPESESRGGVITEWRDATSESSINWTNTNFEHKIRQVGTNIQGRGIITMTGTPTGSALEITLDNYTLDLNPSARSGATPLGSWGNYDSSGTAFNDSGRLTLGSTTSKLLFGQFLDNTSIEGLRNLTPAVGITYGINDEIHFEYDIPVTGLSGTLPTITDQYLQNAQGRFYMSTGPAYTANTIIPFNAISTVIDRIGVNNSSGTLSVDANGTYTVSAVINFTTSITTRLMLYKNGSLIAQMSGKNTGVAHGGNATAKFLTTDVFSVRADTAGTLNPGEAICYIEVTRKSENTGRAASLPFENDGEYGLVKTTGSAEIASGTWTPTVTNVTAAANLTGELSSYALIGTTLTMSGSFLYDSTAAGGLFEVDITIPSGYSIGSGSGTAVLDLSPSNTIQAESFRSATNKIRVRSRVSPTTTGQRARFIVTCTLT